MNRAEEYQKFKRSLENNQLGHLEAPTEKQFEKILKKEGLEDLIKVYKVNFIEKDKTVTGTIAEFNTAEERSRWFEKEGKKIIESEKRGCLVYDEGSPEVGKIEEK